MKIEQAMRELNTIDYFLRNHVNDYPESCHSAIMVAVKSLEAWDKVRTEIETEANAIPYGREYYLDKKN